MTELLIFGLATWRVASLFVREDGPWRVFRRLRESVGMQHDQNGAVYLIPDGFISGILSCVWCCSIWVGFGWGAFFLLTPEIAVRVAAAFSFSTVAIIIDQRLINH